MFNYSLGTMGGMLLGDSDGERVRIELLPGGHGDSILVCCSKDGCDNVNILVDGGTFESYGAGIRDRLVRLAADGERLDLVVVTHVDNDHIGGILEFIRENGPANIPKIIEVGEVWHNSYRHLPISNKPVPDAASLAKVASQSKSVNIDTSPEVGAKEGSMLASLLVQGGYNWNKASENKAIAFGCSLVIGDVEIKVLGPRPDHLEKLLSRWRVELSKMGVDFNAVNSLEFEDYFEKRLLSQNEVQPEESSPVGGSKTLDLPDPKNFRGDNSPMNLSSIVLAIRFGRFSVLFLGDAGAPSVVAAAKEIWGEPESLKFDCVKVSHHGSKANTSHELASFLRAKTFLISTDGTRHNHPHNEALVRLIAENDGCELVYNYLNAIKTLISSDDAVKRYGHSINLPAVDGTNEVNLG